MRCDFFRIACDGSGEDQVVLNKHLASARALSVDRHFVADGPNSFWSVCVVSQAAGQRPEGTGRTSSIDYREVLSAEDFAIYARLRELRKTISAEEAVPPYSVFTNQQLAAIVTGRVSSKAELGKIAGIGEARVAKYGMRFLALIATPAPALEPVSAEG